MSTQSRILNRHTIDSPAGRAVLVALQAPNDSRVSIFVRAAVGQMSMDDAPEVRLRCRPEDFEAMWQCALAQTENLLQNS